VKKLTSLHKPDVSRREALLLRIERLTELPLMVLAFVMIPLLVGPILWRLSPQEEAIFLSLDYFIWALFVVDMGIKIIVAPHRLAYLRRHRLEVLVVHIPFWFSCLGRHEKAGARRFSPCLRCGTGYHSRHCRRFG